MEALGEPSGRLVRAGGGPGGVLGGPGAVLAAYKRRLGGSLGRLGAVLGALEAMLESSGGQKAPKIGAQRGSNIKQFLASISRSMLGAVGHPTIMKNHTGA